jgi:GH25 family lysozyme M1 (1,4-beta-N-acetylmuramidase)
MLYCNGETGYFVYDIAQFQAYPVWYASYSSGWPSYYYGVDIWQYSDVGSVNGIDGYVDLNLMWGGSAVLDKSALSGAESSAAGG